MHSDVIKTPRDSGEGTDLGHALLRLLAAGGEVTLTVMGDEFAAFVKTSDGEHVMRTGTTLTRAVLNVEAA